MALVYMFGHLLSRDFVPAQLGASWSTYLVCFVTIHLGASLFEFLFHRYVLHLVPLRCLVSFRRKHTEHHQLTYVRELKTAAVGTVEVRNKYPITRSDQIKSSTFPGYALVAFWGLFSVVLVPLQLLLPTAPILTTGYLAVVFSFLLYEIIHAIEHLDYDKYWKKYVERFPIVHKIYGFHLMHHWDDRTNQAIGGCFGLPVWDWVFRTYYVPKELPLPGVGRIPTINRPPPPRRLLRPLDRFVERLHRRFLEQQKQAELLKRVQKIGAG